jgi:hypothetical protein
MLTQQEEKQLEFKDVSPRTPLGEKIVAYLEAKHQVENKKTVLEKAKEALIMEFRKERRESKQSIFRIRVGTEIISYENTSKDIIKVEKAKS